MSKLTKGKEAEKAEIRREAYTSRNKTMFAKSMLKPKIALNNRQKYDWDEILREYLSDDQPYLTVREFFAKTRNFKQKTMESKHFKQKTNGWRAMKIEKLNIVRELVQAQSVQDGFSLIKQQQVDYVKAKARFARNTITVLDQLSFGIEQKHVTGDQVLARAKSLQALVKITDSIFEETDKFLKESKKSLQEEEDNAEIEYVIE